MNIVKVEHTDGNFFISIPDRIIESLHLKRGSQLKLEVLEGKMVLSPFKQASTLENLLEESPKDNFKLNDEDKQWMNTPTLGNEE